MQVLYFPLHTHSDSLILGLLIANLVGYGEKVKSRALPWICMAVGVLFLGCAAKMHMEYLNFEGLAFFFGGMVWLSTQREIRVFDAPIFYVISRLSFGMYLNHECIEWATQHRLIAGLGLTHLGGSGAGVVSFALLAVMSAGLSAVTFCLVEHPFLVLRTAVLGRKLVQAGDAPPLVAH